MFVRTKILFLLAMSLKCWYDATYENLFPEEVNTDLLLSRLPVVIGTVWPSTQQ
jgi:hypothetical protein